MMRFEGLSNLELFSMGVEVIVQSLNVSFFSFLKKFEMMFMSMV